MVGTPFCGGSGNPTDVFTATLSHVNKIVVRSPFNPAGTDTVIIDEANGQLRSSSFPRNRPQIFLLTGSGNDTLVINGTNGPDSYEAVGGFVGGRVFMEGDLGVTMSSLGRLIIHGNGGGDRISGHANFPDGGTTVRMEIYGGAGQDTLTVGESGKDRVEGGTEQDFVFTANGKGGDFALGGDGPGNDFITGDAGDTAQGFETKTGGVGTLKLTSRKVKAGADKTGVVGMSWTHPKAWQSLGTVTVKAYDGAKQVGSITIRPKTDEISAKGAIVLLQDETSITKKGKTVRAELAVRTKPSVTAETLRLDVEATDRDGKTQREVDAGIIVIKKRR